MDKKNRTVAMSSPFADDVQLFLANLTVNNKTKEKSQEAFVADHLEVLDTSQTT